jgi:HK97 family phage major capsid protein
MLPPDVSNEIWANALEESAVMRLARRINLPGRGVSIPVITGDAAADWVSETENKTVSTATLGNKLITPYTLAVIEPLSNQFRRDLTALYNELKRRLPSALSRKFDATVFGAAAGAPGSNFDTLGGSAAINIASNTYNALVSARSAVAAANGLLNGWVISPQAESLLMTATDGNGRPLFISDVQSEGAVPNVLGSPTYMSKAVYQTGTPPVLGFAGDWSDAVYGTVEGVQIAISDQATLTSGATTINLFQRNMFAVRAEIEIGFRVKSAAEFVKLVGA